MGPYSTADLRFISSQPKPQWVYKKFGTQKNLSQGPEIRTTLRSKLTECFICIYQL